MGLNYFLKEYLMNVFRGSFVYNSALQLRESLQSYIDGNLYVFIYLKAK